MQRPLGRALTAPQPQEPPPAPAGGCKASTEARVLVINTGGTIGMVQDVKGEGGRGGSGAAEPWVPGGSVGAAPREGMEVLGCVAEPAGLGGVPQLPPWV